MGAVHFSIDDRLLARLTELLPLEVFVETGTFEGDTVDAALTYFDELHTIELSDELFARASARFEQSPGVHTHHGSSPEVLSRLSAGLQRRSVLYWLDAHFCCRDSAGSELQCPLLAELEAIGSLSTGSIVLIDDARLFTGPPPAPFLAEQWPSFSEVIAHLSTLHPSHELMVIDDVIVFFPPQLAEALRRFAQAHAIDWLLALMAARRLDGTMERIERIAGELESQRSTAGRGAEEMQALDAHLVRVHANVDAVQQQLLASSTQLGAVQDSVRALSATQLGDGIGNAETVSQRLRVTLEELALLSSDHGRMRDLLEAHANALAETRTRTESLLTLEEDLVAGLAGVHAEIAEQAADAEGSHKLLEHGRATPAAQLRQDLQDPE